jgi:two-component sensor histidine kinase
VATAPLAKAPRNPISRKQVDKVFSQSASVFGIVFGAQTVPWLLGQLSESYPLWLWIVVPGLFGTLLVAFVLSFVQVGVRQSQGVFAVLYLAALVTWPFAIVPGATVFSGIHWLNYLITVASAMAAIAFSTRIAAIYLFICPIYYVIVRVMPQGGSAPWELAVLEGIYALILGGVILTILTLLRQAASAVDDAQATAIERYSHAVRQHATEVERVQVDSIVHDSVLTTLLSAARAYTPEAKALAATMASSAIGHLRDAALVSPDDGTMVRLSVIADRIADVAATLPGRFDVRVKSIGTKSIPVLAAEAVYSAAVQAMVNSLQHAGDENVPRWLTIRSIQPLGLEVVVGDSGRGFDFAGVASERLGVRISIIERVANTDGHATIRSAIGEGTVVTIRWPKAAARDNAGALASKDAGAPESGIE